MLTLSRDLCRQLDVLMLLTNKEITLKYKRTYLGMFWSLLNPLLFSAIYYVAFKVIMRFPVENYTLFLLVAMFPWTWFSASTLMSCSALIANVTLIKRVTFPRHLIVLSVVLSQLVNFLWALPVLIVMVLVFGITPGLVWLVGFPLMVLIQLMLTLGASLFVSMINAYFGDMEYLIGVAINMLFWVTPIIYPISEVPQELRGYFAFNPLTHLMTAWRDLCMHNTLNWHAIGISALVSGAVLWIGYAVFRSMGERLDEVI